MGMATPQTVKEPEALVPSLVVEQAPVVAKQAAPVASVPSLAAQEALVVPVVPVVVLAVSARYWEVLVTLVPETQTATVALHLLDLQHLLPTLVPAKLETARLLLKVLLQAMLSSAERTKR